jgi:putative ABC transport system permease protein
MIFKMAWKNLLHNRLSSFLCWILLSTGVAIVSLLLLLQQQIEKQFSTSVQNIDMVLGAKGSPLQLILSAVYHIDAPTGNIDFKEAQKWMRHPFVQKAIPLAYGDSYEEYSIVGTSSAYIEHYNGQLSKGKLNNNNFEVVLGSKVAAALKLDTGKIFYSTHGKSKHGKSHKEKGYRVTGILQPSGTVLDHLIISNIESVWNMHESTDDHSEEKENSQQETTKEVVEIHHEITAVLLKFGSPIAKVQLPRIINEQTNMMAAMPAIEMNRLFSLFGVGFTTLQNIGWGIMILSGLSVFVSLYNSLKERKYEMALMRTMGASKMKLLFLVLVEGLVLCLAGLLTGLLLSRMTLFFFAGGFEKDYNLVFKEWMLPLREEYYLAGFALILGIAAAFVPAVKAWFINISKTLSNK